MNLRNFKLNRQARSCAWIRAVSCALFLTLSAQWSFAAPAADDYVFVYRNAAAEWASSGDFNGDGLLDAVIVDRATGVYRVGYQSAMGEHTWVAPRASGVEGVSGFSVGHLINAAAHGFAFTAEAANRVNVVSADDLMEAGLPVPVYFQSVGPNQVMALDIGGAGNTALQDLIVATAWNGVAPYRVTTIRNTDGASFAVLQDVAATRRLDRGNRVVIKDSTSALLAIIERGGTDTLRVTSYAGGPANTFLTITNIPASSDYAVGRFAASGLATFLTYSPGRSNLLTHSVTEPIAGTFEMAPAMGFSFGYAIESIVVLPGTGSTKLLVIFSGGAHAAAYNYDGASAPTLIGEFFPPAGESLLGATPLPGNGFRLHAGAGGRTTRSLQHAFNAGSGSYSLVSSNALPPVNNLSGQANVFQFQSEPFVSPSPGLLSSLNVGDWSSLFSLAGGPPQVGVVSETFVDSAHGLDNPALVSLGSSHPLTAFGLVNQYTEAISIFSLSPGIGNEVVEVTAQPGGGHYGKSVAVSFVVGSPAFQVQYRFGQNGAWQAYSGNPVLIHTNCLLQYRARALLGTAQSSVHEEIYTFKQAANDLDSDSDGVPDYVEIANSLNPAGGGDTDNDGFSDLEELLKGTSPSNAASQPLTKGYEQHAEVDFVLTPRPINGFTGAETSSRGGPRVRVFDGAGSFLAAAPVSAAPASAATVTNVFVDPRRDFFIASTEAHYDVTDLLGDRRIGREIVALVPAPEVAPITVDYQFGGAAGVVNAEAANWVLAAQTAYGKATNEVRHHTLTITNTTIAALFEHKLRSIADTALASNVNLTLFPFRTADAGARQLDDEVLVLFEHGDAALPAYDMAQMLQSLGAIIHAPALEIQALNSVMHEIYRVSAVSNNHAPGLYRLPLDVLRGFLRQGVLDSNYVAGGNFPAPLLADAAAGAQFIIESLGSRPVTNLTLRVREETFAGMCTVLETDDASATPVNLFAPGGGAFDFPDTFSLLPGSIVYVVGRPDMPSTTCTGLNVEVLSISLTAIPARSDGDGDGNLLIDSWEQMFLGMVGNDPFGDEDGDGYSNLQEMYDGTDPDDAAGAPPGPVVPLALPVLNISPPAPEGVTLTWYWPEAYMNVVEFQVMSTTDLNIAPAPQAISPVHEGGGVFSVTLAKPETGAQFFQVILSPRR